MILRGGNASPTEKSPNSSRPVLSQHGHQETTARALSSIDVVSHASVGVHCGPGAARASGGGHNLVRFRSGRIVALFMMWLPLSHTWLATPLLAWCEMLPAALRQLVVTQAETGQDERRDDAPAKGAGRRMLPLSLVA